MTPPLTRFIVSVEGSVCRPGYRRRLAARMYVTGVSWQLRGSSIERFSYSSDKRLAVTFAKLTAEQLVATLSSRFRCVDVRMEPEVTAVTPVPEARS